LMSYTVMTFVLIVLILYGCRLRTP
jgi:hypothetical protein